MRKRLSAKPLVGLLSDGSSVCLYIIGQSLCYVCCSIAHTSHPASFFLFSEDMRTAAVGSGDETCDGARTCDVVT